MQTINEWLASDRDYASGLALLAQYSKNRILLQSLSRKTMPGKLEYELRKLSKTPELPVVPPSNTLPATDPVPTPIPIEGKPKINPDDLPDHLRQLWQETAEKYRLARAVHEQLKLKTEADQRAPLIEQLENYQKEIRANWEVIDTWTKEQNQEISSVTVDEKRINANRKYLSEGKKTVASLFGAPRAKKLEAMQRRINELLSAGEKFDPENQKELEELGMKFDG